MRDVVEITCSMVHIEHYFRFADFTLVNSFPFCAVPLKLSLLQVLFIRSDFY